MSLKKAFDARRPSRAKETAARSRLSAERFVEGGTKSERQNLWLDAELRMEVGLQSRKNRETISAFATRAFRRELADPTFVSRADSE